MLTPEVLDGYSTSSDWKPAGSESPEGGPCTRCGDQGGTVSMCMPCLLEVAARVAAGGTAEQVVRTRRKTPKKRRAGILEWFFVMLLSLGALITGSLLNAVLH